MENTQHAYQTPRYMEVAPNGQILRQAPTVPPEVSNYLSPRQSVSYSPTQSNYSSAPSYAYSSSSNGKQWWQPTGAYNPYRTTYQDYGNAKQQPAVYQTPTAHFMTRPGQYM